MPQVSSYYSIVHVADGETRVQIVNTEKGGKSFQTIKFPKGTEIRILVSKHPPVEVKK